ncbi:N-acetylglutamate synthase-like GNAT family acetyltransferase [Nonomuraea thailandensis]|uniref:N-acetylglutamate synthase-like GNAT family acetyltransferase n=1 Tax=Nonomuraea thailandensis TaxID=1188745 RepID=A0A9X2GPU8_9ACTN|nr:GNAT family N-acetyltransferase [Nonomuraea thailandensis]MCP2361174.1 N-acetylglutamate synthase-like GNAT family acetyltransferase [Nonomuraea thailandensis]
MDISVRDIGPGDLPVVTRVITESWGGTTLMVLGGGKEVDVVELPGFIAEAEGEVAGILTYVEEGGEVEVASLNAVLPGRGAGRALLDAVRAVAAGRGMTRLWLVTTNDNTHALRFYQRYGFDLVALHRNAMDRVRAVKPDIPAESDGIPIRHELELELRL